MLKETKPQSDLVVKHLDQPIVIPSICYDSKTYNTIGIPYVRAYAPCLADRGISEEDFLAFLDELNILNCGHHRLNYVAQAGQMIQFAGNFDPTKITSLVGAGIQANGQLAAWGSASGPLSLKKTFLRQSNKVLFGPKGLQVGIVNSKKLRQLLELHTDAALLTPLSPDYAVPSVEQLIAGERSIVKVPQRQMLAISSCVSELKFCQEYSPSFYSQTSDMRKKAAASVMTLQIGAEVKFEIWRGEALEKLKKVATSKTEKERKAAIKAARKADREAAAVEKLDWLVVQSL